MSRWQTWKWPWMVDQVMSQMIKKTHFERWEIKDEQTTSMNGGMPGMRWLWQGTLPGSPTFDYNRLKHLFSRILFSLFPNLKWPSFRNCSTCFGAEPPAPVSRSLPPASRGTMESIWDSHFRNYNLHFSTLAEVPSSRMGKRSVR